MSLKHDLYLSRKPLAGYMAIGMAWATYFAQMPVIKANVGASDGEYGAALLLTSLGAVAAMWLAPFCLRAFGGRAISIALIVLALGMGIAGSAAWLPVLVLGMAMAAMGTGVVDVLVNARVSEIEAATGRTLMNLNHALYAFAYAGGALLTGVLREAQVPTMVIFGVLIACLLVLSWAAQDKAVSLDEAIPAGDAQMPVGLVLLVGFVVLAAFLTETATEGWSALHVERTLGGSAGQGAMGPALLGLMMGIGRLSGHALAQRMRDTTLMLVATLIAACGLVLAAVAGSVATALVGFAVAGLGISVVVPLAFALLGRVVPPETRLAAISRASVLGYGAFFFGPPLMGLVAEAFGLRVSFMVAAAILVATALVLLPMLARRTRVG